MRVDTLCTFSWYMSWYVSLGSCTWSDMRVDTLCTFSWYMSWYVSLWFMYMKWHTCWYAVHFSWYMSWYVSLWFMYMKWHTCWYAVHFSWYMGWYVSLWFMYMKWHACWYAVHFFVVHELICFLMVHVHEVTYVLIRCALFRGTWVDMFPYGSCTWSDIRVDTLCTFSWYMSWYVSLWFMYMKWHACWYAMHFFVVHELICFLMVHVHEVTCVLIRCALFRGTWVDMFPYGSCTWSDIRVDTLCSFRGTWVDMFP